MEQELDEKKRLKMEAKLQKKQAKAQKKEEEKQRELEEKRIAKEREKIYKDMVAYEKVHKTEEKVAPEGVYISLQHINKIYSNYVQAVFDFNLDIKEKEFIIFVGPSGCGKSTTLRMIAGLEDITAGDLYIDGDYANDLEPKDRNVSMVFQSYALYPHLTVYDNMAFGLQMRHVPKAEIDERVHNAAKILEIEDYLERKPKALSGGQCQRVALGRAIVRDSKVFLMDEPLSNLDAKLRVQMRSELVKLHNELGATTIYVTHDQTEAMTMATRIVVMNKGYVQQIGAPEEIYNNPANTFVATFIGSPAMNVFEATYNKGNIEFENGFKIKLDRKMVTKHNAFYRLEADQVRELLNNATDENEQANLKEKLDLLTNISKGQEHKIVFGVRPEDIVQKGIISPATNLSEYFPSKVEVAELLGNEYYVHTIFGTKKIVAKVFATMKIQSGATVEMAFNLDKIHIFDFETGKHI